MEHYHRRAKVARMKSRFIRKSGVGQGTSIMQFNGLN